MKNKILIGLFLLLLTTGLGLTAHTLLYATVNTSSAANRYTANGSTVDFSYTFKVLRKQDIEVLVDTTTKTVDVDYTVSGVGSAGGGTITFLSAPANASIVTLLRSQPASQLSVYSPGEPFPSVRVEKDFDKLVMQVQQLAEQVSRALKFQKLSTLTAQDVDDPTTGLFARSKVGGGIDWANVVSAGSISVPVAVNQGGTGSTTAAAARTTLGAVADTNGAMTDKLTISGIGGATHVPKLLLDNTHATERRGQIQFLSNGTTKFIIGTDLDAANGSNTLTFYDAEAAENRLQIAADGSMIVTRGQLKFPVTQVPSADAHTLDDYEEGTWTPSLGGNTAYTTQSGTYIKVGRLVYIQMKVVVNTIGTGSTTTISGLPFTCDFDATLAVGPTSGLAVAPVSLNPKIASGAATIVMEGRTAANAASSSQAIYGNAASIILTGHYTTAD